MYKNVNKDNSSSRPLLIQITFISYFHNSERNLLLYLFLKKVIKLTAVNIGSYHYYQFYTNSSPVFLS
jgi:hypothetical protein